MTTETAKKTKTADDKYKSAALDIVQEQMRIDNFAPRILYAVKKDVDLRDGIKTVVAEAIREKEDVKEEISKVVDQNQTNKIYKILRTGAIILGTAIITGVGTWLVAQALPQDDSRNDELQKRIENLEK